MVAPKGNQFWKKRTKHGRDKLFANAELLWEACTEYFDWVESTPLEEHTISFFQGNPTHEYIKKMRAMTLGGLCVFLDIDKKTWDDWRTKQDFSLVTQKVDEIIRDQKFAGAAAGMLNANIIARDLGLSDKKDLVSSDGSMTPKQELDTSKLSTETLNDLMRARGESE